MPQNRLEKLFNMNYLRKPFFSLLLLFLIFSSSCVQYDAFPINNIVNEDLNLKTNIREVTNLIIANSSNDRNENTFEIVDNYLIEHGVDVLPFKSVMESMNYETNNLNVISVLESNGDLTRDQYLILKEFLENILDSKSSEDIYAEFEVVASVIETTNITQDEIIELNMIIDILKLSVDELIYMDTFSSDRLNILCGLAIAGWGIAFAALVTATAGTVALAAASYVVATGSLAGCA